MKKILLIITVLLSLNICACQSGQTSDTPKETPEAKQTTHTEPQNVPETQPSDENTISCLYEFFMDDTNLNGSPIGPSETDEYGGPVYGYTDPAHIPDTDRSALYGTTYRFGLTAHKDKHLFCFRYDNATSRLEVVIPYERISLLLVFRVEGVEDGGAVVRSAETSEYISATLLYARNIDSGRAIALQAASSLLEDQATPTSPSIRSGHIVGYAVSTGTYLQSTWGDHDAFQWMDTIISLYGEEAS